MRVKGGPKGLQRHKRVLKLAKGYAGQRSKIYRRAHEAVLHAGEYAFAGRKLRRRNFRTLWIQRIKAALSPFDLKYSRFIKLLEDKKIELDRKILATLAVDDPATFAKIVEKVKA
ncbi:MAG: 50S ribosomal protein L20 [bacterium]|nr:50S ribosomal protein L20 [bacterium]